MKPMLATAKKANQPNDPSLYAGWIADHKLDGLRAIVEWWGGDLKIFNRNEIDITRQFPEIEQALTRALRGQPPIRLDGEIVALDGLFNTVATRGKQTKPLDIVNGAKKQPCQLVVFDLLHYNETIHHRPLFERRVLMTHLLNVTGIVGVVTMDNPPLLFDLVKEQGLEGIIAKNPGSTYQPGRRSPDWIKIKATQRVTCVGTGYDTGQGARKAFGAMHIAMVGPGGPVPVGKVGTGFNAADIDFLKAELDAGHPVLCEIECLNRTGSNQLRFPVYVGPRPDLSVLDASIAQLDLLPLC